MQKMATEVSPEIIQSTQKLLGKHVTKPQLSEKLLNKPPFRFLHDVITVLVRNGFLKGLYSDSELNSENVKDREAKIAFLNKLITAVKTLSGRDLPVKSSKIIAGLEATETNRLLQVIAKLIDDKIDTRAYVKNLKKPGMKTETLPESARDGGITIKSAFFKTSPSKDNVDGARKKTDQKTKNKKGEDVSPTSKIASTTKTKSDLKRNTKSEKIGKTSSRTSPANKATKNEKTTRPSTKDKISPRDKSKVTPKTSTTLLTQSEEMKADKNDKTIESPEHLPEMITSQENTEDDMATAIIDNIDNSPRDDSWKPQIIKDDNDKLIEMPPSYQTLEMNKTLDPKSDKNETLEDTIKSTVHVDNKPKEEVIRQPSARPKSAKPRSGNIDNRSVPMIPPQSKEDLIDSFTEQPIIKPLVAPKDKTFKEIKSNMILNTMLEKQEEKAATPTPFRPKSSMLRPPSVRPSSARPGAPRLRAESSLPLKEVIPLGKINVIIENFDAIDASKEDDEEETVVIQSLPNETQVESTISNKNLNLDIPVDRGHLVDQILEQMQDGDDGGEQAQLDWEHEGNKSKDASTKEITALRASIQALTKTANPLGKLASYLHEDVEAMQSELETWLNMKRQYAAEIAKQKRVNNESNQPLQMQLQSLEESIKHERNEIFAVKYNILRNEQRIRHLVSKQIAMD